ncbi:MAG: biotin--[acetyl-CoA-carboxylase] ligase [Acholeplasmataceae bacterium]|nr:biotin--[acetyl-CoA-carboxylase] ligase [Acholeplasmataceae bacterium]
MKTIHLESIDSTNSYLKRNYKELSNFTWVTSEIQTHGKGRMNKTWIGSKDALMCSTIINHEITTSNLSLYPLLAAVSLHKVLSKYINHLMIKWPNDIYLKDKKLAGILCESIIEANQVHALIIGFGVNLNQKSFNDELKDIATSLYQYTNQTYDKELILNNLKNQLTIDLNAYIQNPLNTIDYCNNYHYLN